MYMRPSWADYAGKFKIPRLLTPQKHLAPHGSKRYSLSHPQPQSSECGSTFHLGSPWNWKCVVYCGKASKTRMLINNLNCLPVVVTKNASKGTIEYAGGKKKKSSHQSNCLESFCEIIRRKKDFLH